MSPPVSGLYVFVTYFHKLWVYLFNFLHSLFLPTFYLTQRSKVKILFTYLFSGFLPVTNIINRYTNSK